VVHRNGFVRLAAFEKRARVGRWYLLVFTIVGIIPVIYWLEKAGNDEDNQYGSKP
jgi:hypothetical protein